MAKTKRRQLAALAAQAELKALAGYNATTSSFDKSGLSGNHRKTGEPMVELRTQRVIFKIPALPPKPAADIQSLKTANKGGLRYRRREIPQTDIDPSSEQVPADEAKISRGVFLLGKWKRHKKISDLLPPRVRAVLPSSAGLSNGGQLPPVAKSVATDEHINGELPLSGAGFQNPAKRTVQRMAGPRKRAKVQEAVVRSPAEEDTKIMKTLGRSKGPIDRTLDRAADSLVMSKRRSRDLGKDTDRLRELARAGDGDLLRTEEHSPPSPKRRQRSSAKVISRLPVSPKVTIVSPHRTRSRVKISQCEAMALEVLQEIQNVQNISQHMGNSGNIAENYTRLRRTPDGEAVYTTRDQSQAEPQNCGNLTRSLAQEEGQVAYVDSSSQEVMRSGPHTSRHTCSQGDDLGDFKSRIHIEEPDMPLAPCKQGVCLVVQKHGEDLVKSSRPSEGNSIAPRGAEMIKRDSQLTIMEKRLRAAGGLRNWLLDKGLGQFLPILEKWNIDNLSLMQLTMEGLKSMGLLPVGPRRKLIHAMSSLTLPSFSKAPPLNANPR